jgi:UDP-N-acetylmuramyl pentapeptide synthase
MFKIIAKFLGKSSKDSSDNSDRLGIIGESFPNVTITALRAIYLPRMEVVENPTKGLFKKEPKGKIIIDMNKNEDSKVLITNLLISRIHPSTDQEQLKKLEAVLKSLNSTNTVVADWDDNISKKIMEQTDVQAFFYGSNGDHCHVWSSNFRINNFQSHFELNYGVERVEIKTPLLGKEQINALTAAAAIALSDNFSLMEIKRGLEKLTPLEHTLEPLSGYNNSFVLDDTQTEDPNAIVNSLDLLNYLTARRRMVVLGSLETTSKKYYQEIAQKIYKDKVDLVFLTVGDAKMIKDELLNLGFISERIESNLQIPQVVSLLLRMMSKGDVVLVEGSPKLKMSEIVRRISQK